MGGGVIWTSGGDIIAGRLAIVAGVFLAGGAREGVAGGVSEPSRAKSGIGKGGGVSPGSEDWYVTMGVDGKSCWIASRGTDMAVMFGVGSCLPPGSGRVCDTVPSGAVSLLLVFSLLDLGGSAPFLFFLFFHISAVAAAGPLRRAVLAAAVVLGREGSLRGVLVPLPAGEGVGWVEVVSAVMVVMWEVGVGGSSCVSVVK